MRPKRLDHRTGYEDTAVELFGMQNAWDTVTHLVVSDTEELLPDVLEGRIEPGRVLDRVTNIDGVPDGYRAMNERESIKVMIEF